MDENNNPTDQSCGTCRFGCMLDGGNLALRDCRANPPQIIVIKNEKYEEEKEHDEDAKKWLVQGYWPPVDMKKWCGQWRAHPDVEASAPRSE